MQRLTQALLDLPRFAPDEAAAARAAMEAALGTLDRLQARTRGARGEARAALLATLATADDALAAALSASLPAAVAGDLTRAARAELAPFAGRMAAPDLASAERAAWRGWPGPVPRPELTARASSRGERSAAFDGRCIPAFGVRRAPRPSRATRHSHHGLLSFEHERRAADGR